MDIPVLCYKKEIFFLFVTSADDAHSATLIVSVAVYILFLFFLIILSCARLATVRDVPKQRDRVFDKPCDGDVITTGPGV